MTAVEVRDVILPESMKRAMAGQAEVGAGATCESYKRLRHILQIIDNIFAVLDAPFRYPLRNITLEVGVKFVREVVID